MRVLGAPGATDEYVGGDKSLRFVRCRKCGCVTHWQLIEPREVGRMGANARNFEPDAVESVRVRMLDGASTWKYQD